MKWLISVGWILFKDRKYSMREAITQGEGKCQQQNNREQNYRNNAAVCPGITLTKITSYKPQELTKCYSLGDDGKPQAKTSANITEGLAEIVELANLGEFSKMLASLGYNQALCFGVLKQSPVKLLTKKRFEEKGRPAGYATRSKEMFSWPDGTGLMLLDYDPRPGHPAILREQLREQLHSAAPALSGAATVEWLSSSSMIYNSETQDRRVTKMLIKITEVMELAGVSRPTIWRWSRESKHGFPQAISMGNRCTRWNKEEVLAWIARQTETRGAE